MGARQVQQPAAMYLAVITDMRDTTVVEVQPTKELLYQTITEASDQGQIEGLDYDNVEELTISIYEVTTKPWKLELGRSKVTFTEKSE